MLSTIIALFVGGAVGLAAGIWLALDSYDKGWDDGWAAALR